MNEPLQRVHSQEDSSSLGIYAKQIGINVGLSAASEFGVAYAAKKVKHPEMKSMLHNAAHGKPTSGNQFMRTITAGMSTKRGRALNYGMAIGTGLLMGAIQTKDR